MRNKNKIGSQSPISTLQVVSKRTVTWQIESEQQAYVSFYFKGSNPVFRFSFHAVQLSSDYQETVQPTLHKATYAQYCFHNKANTLYTVQGTNIPYILESNPHPNLIRTSFYRFLKRKKSQFAVLIRTFPSTAPCAQLLQKSRGGCRLQGKSSRRALSSDLS